MTKRKANLSNRRLRRKQTIEQRLNFFKARPPSRFLHKVAMPIYIRKYIVPKNVNFKYNFDISTLKPPFLVLFAHPSIKDHIFVTRAIRPFVANSVVSRWYFHNAFLRFLLPIVGGIPKRLFTNEPNVVKNVISVVRKGGIVNISPEGINTPSGESLSLIPSTTKLIKKLNVPVVSVAVNGAFLTFPSYNYKAKHVGRIDVIVDLMFTPEEIAQKSNEELLAEMSRKLHYDDFKWARENNVEFKAKNRTKGLNNLLYICPKCKSQFKMETADNEIKCSECGFGAFVDNSFQLVSLGEDDVLPDDIVQWFNMQDDIIKSEVKADDFEIREKCSVKNFSKRGFRLVDKYKGELIINKGGVRFIGKDIKTGREKEIFKEIEQLPRVSNTINKGIYFYDGDVCCEFEFENGVKTIQCTQAIHHLHNLREELA